MGTKIIKCSCRHSFQDKEYGKGNRLANISGKSESLGTVEVTCTVCNKKQRVKK